MEPLVGAGGGGGCDAHAFVNDDDDADDNDAEHNAAQFTRLPQVTRAPLSARMGSASP